MMIVPKPYPCCTYPRQAPRELAIQHLVDRSRELYQGKHKAIISQGLFDIVPQQVKKSRAQRHTILRRYSMEASEWSG